MVLEIEGAGSFQLMQRRTIECDIHLTNLLRAAGTEQALVAAIQAQEEPDSRIFEAVSSSGKLFDILAALLVPEGMDALQWSPQLARETTEKLKHVVTDAGKHTLVKSVVPLVIGFFLAGLHSLATSRKSSTAPGRVQPDSESAETTTMATGASWSGNWRASIRNALRRLSSGR